MGSLKLALSTTNMKRIEKRDERENCCPWFLAFLHYIWSVWHSLFFLKVAFFGATFALSLSVRLSCFSRSFFRHAKPAPTSPNDDFYAEKLLQIMLVRCCEYRTQKKKEGGRKKLDGRERKQVLRAAAL